MVLGKHSLWTSLKDYQNLNPSTASWFDKFTKYAHFLPWSHPFTALEVATLFMNNIFKLHGLPQAIVSDRDKIFTSNLWKELFKLLGTQLHMSSAYHP
jgi:hypothetical protein